MGKRTAVLLGAGASAPLGFPVTDQILPAIWRGLSDPATWSTWAGLDGGPSGEAEVAALRRFLGWMLPGLEDGHAQVRGASIVEVISLLDQSLAEGRSPHPMLEEDDLRRARVLLNKGINGVLQGRSKPRLRQRLAGWLVAEAQGGDRVTLASTNYDTAIEQEVFNLLGERVPDEIDFGMPWRDPEVDALHVRPRDARLAVLKLHGSLNWLRCETCAYVYVNPRGRIAPRSFEVERSEYNECHCGGRLRLVIVTPSVVRDVRDVNLLSVWNATLEDFRRADEWILIGYSLPSEDVAIRSLLLRAFHARTAADVRVRVVQWEDPARPAPPEGSQEYWRYRMFFPGRNLKEADYLRSGVEGFVEGLPDPGRPAGG